MKRLKHCQGLIGDYRTFNSTLVPAREFVAGLPGKVVIPEFEIWTLPPITKVIRG